MIGCGVRLTIQPGTQSFIDIPPEFIHRPRSHERFRDIFDESNEAGLGVSRFARGCRSRCRLVAADASLSTHHSGDDAAISLADIILCMVGRPDADSGDVQLQEHHGGS